MTFPGGPDRRSLPIPSLAPVIAALLLSLFAGNVRAWSFAVAGDSRDDRSGVMSSITAEVESSQAEFLLHTGDLESGGGDAKWSAFRNRIAALGKPFHPVLGNHEIRGEGTREGFARFFGLPGTSYAFIHRNVRFLVVDDADGRLPEATFAWIGRELSAHPRGKDGLEHLAVAMHVPPETGRIAPHGTEAEWRSTSERLRELLERHRVSLLLCGHEHLQHVEDWGSIRLIVTGGAGAPMFPLQRFGYFRVDVDGMTVTESFVPAEAGRRR